MVTASKRSSKKKTHEINYNITPGDLKNAQDILYNLWFTIAERIFERVSKETGLTEEQKNALKIVALRPNDFQIVVSENK
jgi:hypothetical protein